MRQSRTYLTHVVVVLLLTSMAGLWAFHARDKGPANIRTSDTTSVFYRTVIEARHVRQQQLQPTLLESVTDGLLSTLRSTKTSALYQGLFDSYLTAVYLSTGDVLAAYKILVFPLNLAFLVGAYLMFLHVTTKPMTSAWLALLASMPVFLPLAGEHFGMGPVTLFSRRHLFTAFAPCILWLYYRYQGSTRGMLATFALAGVVSNLHASGILLIEVLAVTLLIRKGLDWQRVRLTASGLLIALVMGGIAVGSLWWQIGEFLQSLVESAVPSAHASGGLHKQIDKELGYLFYPPHILSHWPEWLVHVVSFAVAAVVLAPLLLRAKVKQEAYSHLLFFAVTAAVAFLAFSEFKYWLVFGTGLYAIGRRRPPDVAFEVTHVAIIAIYVVSFLGMLLFQAAYLLFDNMPLVFNQIRGVRFLGIWVYLWIAVLMRDACWPTASSALKLFVVTAMVVATFSDIRILVRDNFRAPAHQAVTQSLMAAARWARDNTDGSAKFVVASSAFGIVAEREVYIGDKTRPGQEDFKRGDAESLLSLARAQGMDYIVIEKDKPQSLRGGGIDVPYENEHFAIAPVAR